MHISCNAAAGDFNPRSREGSDGEVSGGDMGADISIHAPARGATRHYRSFTAATRKISIHAPARGATAEYAHYTNSVLFQSTLPRGERPVAFRFFSSSV